MAGVFELYTDRQGEWRFRLKATSGQIVAVGEAYSSRDAAQKGAIAVQNAAFGADFVDLTR